MKKNRVKILHRPSTLQTFYCLSNTATWVEKLQGTGRPYEAFLQKLMVKKYFLNIEERKTVKWMASELGFETNQVTKWIKEIYDDIFELNYYHPNIFQSDGIKHSLHFRYYDDSEVLTVWLSQTPRVHEKLECYFVKARIGTDNFWVSEVKHEIQNGNQHIHITLKGGFHNTYREQLIQRALFEKVIGLRELYDMYEFEMDELLLKHYDKN